MRFSKCFCNFKMMATDIVKHTILKFCCFIEAVHKMKDATPLTTPKSALAETLLSNVNSIHVQSIISEDQKNTTTHKINN